MTLSISTRKPEMPSMFVPEETAPIWKLQRTFSELLFSQKNTASAIACPHIMKFLTNWRLSIKKTKPTPFRTILTFSIKLFPHWWLLWRTNVDWKNLKKLLKAKLRALLTTLFSQKVSIWPNVWLRIFRFLVRLKNLPRRILLKDFLNMLTLFYILELNWLMPLKRNVEENNWNNSWTLSYQENVKILLLKLSKVDQVLLKKLLRVRIWAACSCQSLEFWPMLTKLRRTAHSFKKLKKLLNQKLLKNNEWKFKLSLSDK